jgi:hypothetical protein
MWHTGGGRRYGATAVAFASQHMSAVDRSEQRSGKRWGLSGCKAVARRSAEFRRTNQWRIGEDPSGAAVQSLSVVAAISEGWNRGSAGRVPVGSAIGIVRETATTIGGYSGQRSGSLRCGQRHLDLADDCLGDRNGVRRSVSSRPRSQTASQLGIFCATAAPRAGPRRRCGTRSMAPPHLSRP